METPTAADLGKRLRHSLSCPHTSSTTHCPISEIRPRSSAVPMNWPGEIRPRSGCFQRRSASKLTTRPDPASTTGW